MHSVLMLRQSNNITREILRVGLGPGMEEWEMVRNVISISDSLPQLSLLSEMSSKCTHIDQPSLLDFMREMHACLSLFLENNLNLI